MRQKFGAFQRLQKRFHRTLNYDSRKMHRIPLPLSELVVDYFDKKAPYDYMTLDFATNLARNGCVDPCTFLVAMVYIDRVRVADKTYFESSDPNDIYLSALVIASKFLYDGGLEEFVYNDEWAASASTSLDRVNELELRMLDILSWNINVSEKEFEHVLRETEYWVAKNAYMKRGFFTYNETNILSSKMCLFGEVLVPLVAVLTGLLIAYSAVVLSILMTPNVAFSARTLDNASYNIAELKDILKGIGHVGRIPYDVKQFMTTTENHDISIINDDYWLGDEDQGRNRLTAPLNFSHGIFEFRLSNSLMGLIPFRSFT